MRYTAWLDWSKMVIHFLVDTKRAGVQASKWIYPLRQILFIILGSYFNDVCCTPLEKINQDLTDINQCFTDINDTQTLYNITSGVMAQSGIIHTLWHDFL